MPVKRLTVPLCLLVLSCTVLGQTPPAIEIVGKHHVADFDRIIVVKEKKIVVEELPFKLNAPTGGFLYIWEYPPTVQASRSARGQVLEVISAPNGEITFRVEAAVIKAGQGTTDEYSITLVIGSAVPPPKPPPLPVPVVSPLQKSLQTAYTADADPDGAPKIAALSELLGSVVSVAQASKKMTIAKDFTTYVDNAINIHPNIGKGSLPLTERAIGAYLSQAMAPALASAPCDKTYWEKAGAAYSAVAEALKGVK